ncbi:hypothetical protein ACOMHN_060347 [Nucella lapillus]
MTLMLPAVTSQWTQYCPSPRDIQMFDQTFRGPELETMAEIPPLKAMVDDLRGADKEIRMVVTEDILREMSIVVKKTDFRYNYLIAYCPHYFPRYVKLLVRIPTNCRCLAGCNRRLEDGDDRNRASLVRRIAL